MDKQSGVVCIGGEGKGKTIKSAPHESQPKKPSTYSNTNFIYYPALYLH